MVEPVITQIQVPHCLKNSSCQARRHLPSSSTRMDMKIGCGCTTTPAWLQMGVMSPPKRREGRTKAVLSINMPKGQTTRQAGMKDGQGRERPSTMSYTRRWGPTGKLMMVPLGSCTWSTGWVCARRRERGGMPMGLISSISRPEVMILNYYELLLTWRKGRKFEGKYRLK